MYGKTGDCQGNVCYSSGKFDDCLMHLEPRLQMYIQKRIEHMKLGLPPSTLPSLDKQFKIKPCDTEKLKSYIRCQRNRGFMQDAIFDGFFDRFGCGTDFTVQDRRLDGLPFGKDPFDSCQTSCRSGCSYKKLVPQIPPNTVRAGAPMSEVLGSTVPSVSPCVAPPGLILEKGNYADFQWIPPVVKTTPCDNSMCRNFRYSTRGIDDCCFTKEKYIEDEKQARYQTRNFKDDYKGRVEARRREVIYGEPGLLTTEGFFNPKRIDDDTMLKFGDYQSRSGASCASNMDCRNKWFIPKARTRCYPEDLNHSFYQPVPYMGQGWGLGDVDIDTYLKHGAQTMESKQKKLGGVEIDRFEDLPRDMQDPRHIVLPFPRGGIDTRFLDKYARSKAEFVI